VKTFAPNMHYFVAGCFLALSVLVLFSMSITIVAPVADFTKYDPVVFNLFYYVPVTFWIGILGLSVLFLYLFIRPNRFSPVFVNVLLFLIMLIVLVAFFGLPNLVEPNPRFVDSWVHGKAAKNIFESGFLVPTKQLSYLTYPSSFMFLSMLSNGFGVEITVLLRFLPVGLILMFFTFLTVFFERIFGDMRQSVVAVFIFALSTFYFAFHFSPEIFGWLFFFLLFAFIAKGIKQKSEGQIVPNSDTLIIMFLIVAIALTHPVTQFTVLLLLTTLLIFGAMTRKIRYVSSNMVLFAAIVFVAWAMYFGYVYFDIIIQGFETAFRRIIGDLSASIAARAITESSPAAVADLLLYRRILYVLTPLMGVFGGIIYFRKRRLNFNFLFCFIAAAAIMFPLTVVGILPLERSIKIAFIPLSLFGAVLICSKRKIGVLLLAFLLFTIPINFASVYWGEASTMTHDWELASSMFVSDNFHGVLLGEFKTTSIMNYYGDFRAIFNDYSLYGYRPNIFNLTYIEENHVQVVYITQLTLYRAESLGLEVNMDSFLNSPEFSCVHSDGYSYVLMREVNATELMFP
jgi:hypothetical protein